MRNLSTRPEATTSWALLNADVVCGGWTRVHTLVAGLVNWTRAQGIVLPCPAVFPNRQTNVTRVISVMAPLLMISMLRHDPTSGRYP